MKYIVPGIWYGGVRLYVIAFVGCFRQPQTHRVWVSTSFSSAWQRFGEWGGGRALANVSDVKMTRGLSANRDAEWSFFLLADKFQACPIQAFASVRPCTVLVTRILPCGEGTIIFMFAGPRLHGVWLHTFFCYPSFAFYGVRPYLVLCSVFVSPECGGKGAG